MSKRVYFQSAKKWAIKAGIPSGIAGFALIFYYILYLQAITITGFSQDTICAGTEIDPCIALINFTANEDVFLYPVNYDPYGRDTPFDVDKELKSWKMYRSWGKGWREIKLDQTCQQKWCGAPENNMKDNKYSIAFRKDKNYTIKIEALKKDPSEDIKWGFGYKEIGLQGGDSYVDPVFLGLNGKNIFPKLIENKADLTYGEAIFEFVNPYDGLDLDKYLQFTFINPLGSGMNDYKIYINYSKVKLVPDSYGEPIPINTTCRETVNSIEKTWACTKKLTNVTSYRKEYSEDWKLANEIIDKGIYKIKIHADWNPEIGERAIDWQPQVIYKKELISSEKDLIVSKPEWAWWNTSWTNKRQITFTFTGGDTQVAIFNLSADNFTVQADGSDFRFVNFTDDLLLNATLQEKIDDSWWKVRVHNNNYTQIYVYYNNPTANSYFSWDDLYAAGAQAFIGGFTFDEASGNLKTMFDSADLDVPPSGSPLYSQTGKIDDAIGFDSNDDYFRNDTTSSLTPYELDYEHGDNTGYTVSCFINYTQLTDDIVILSSNGASYPRYQIAIDTNNGEAGGLRWEIANSAGNSNMINRTISGASETRLHRGTTQSFIFFTYKDSRFAEDEEQGLGIILDGTVSTAADPIGLDVNMTVNSLEFGDSRGDRFFNETLDDCTFWNETSTTQSLPSHAKVNHLFLNQTRNVDFSLGVEQVNLNVTLNNPIEFFNTSNPTIIFNATVSGSNPVNITLYLDNIANETNSTGIQDDYIFTKIISDGVHPWTIESCDSTSCSNVTSRNFTIETVSPVLSYVSPTENNNSNVSQTWVFINATLTEINPLNITFRIGNNTFSNFTTWATDNVSNMSINFTSLGEDTYTYNVTSCDTFSNCQTLDDRFITLDTTILDLEITFPENITYILNTTNNPNLTHISINIGTNYCYQESANTTNQTGIDGDCSLNYTGAYDPYGSVYNWTDPGPHNIYDGNWDTSATPTGDPILLINYTIPSGIINGTQWDVKYSDFAETSVTRENLTIDNSCVSSNILQLKVNASQGTAKAWFSCWDSSDWVVLREGDRRVFEEAILWKFTPNNSLTSSEIDSCWYSVDNGATNNTFTCTNNVTGLEAVNGTQTWYVGINDTAGNINWTFTVFTLNSSFLEFNATLSSGITFTFNPDNQTHQAVQPTGQNSTVGALTIHNNLTGDIDIYAKINDSSLTNITLKIYSKASRFLLDGLIGYWPFNIDAKDISGNSNNGVVTGATFNSTGGKLDGAYEFDGINDYIEIIDSNSLDILESATISAWIKTDINEVVVNKVENEAYDCGAYLWELWGGGDGGFCIGEVRKTVSSTVDSNDGSWHHLISRYNGTSIQLYLDGVPNGAILVSGNINVTTANLYIGSKSAGSHPFNGTIDDVRIYNRSLNQTEISQLYNISQYSYSIPINTTYQVVYKNLTVGDTQYLWTWGDYNNPILRWIPRLTIKGVSI